MADAKRDTKKKNADSAASLKPADMKKRDSGSSAGEDANIMRRKKTSVEHSQIVDTFTENREIKRSFAIPPQPSDCVVSLAVTVNKTGARSVRENYTPKIGVVNPISLTRTTYARPKFKQVENSATALKASGDRNQFVDTKSVQTLKEHRLAMDRHTDTFIPDARGKTLQNHNYGTKIPDRSCINAKSSSTKDAAGRGLIQTPKNSGHVSPRPTQVLPKTHSEKSVLVRPKTSPNGKSQFAELRPSSSKDVMKRSLVNHEPTLRRPNIPSSSSNSQMGDTEMIIIIMNAKGKGHTSPEERRRCIANTVKSKKPKLLLFQEFEWKTGISGKIWEESPIPKHYQYFGNQEASVLYDIRDVVAIALNSTEVRRILENLQRTSNNAFKSPFPMDFDPLSRMCACTVSTIGVPFWEFICVSWHGPWNGWSLDRRKTYFQYLLEFLKKIMARFKRPLLIAGDFNIDFPDIVGFIKHPFKKYDYTPSIRRKGVVKDYFITSIDMNLIKLDYVNIGSYESCLDHDPILSCLSEVIV